MDKQFVSDLQDKEKVNSAFLAKEKRILTDKKGNEYISLRLSDKTGFVDARVWDNVESLRNQFQAGDLINVKGIVQVYQDRKQVIVHKVQPLETEEVQWEHFVAKSDRDPAEMYQEILQVVESLENRHIKQLLKTTMQDPSLKEPLLKAPAAKTIHHAKEGGLLEHVLSLCNLVDNVCKHYAHLNRDIMIFGVIFHDIGKIWELDIDNTGIRYSTEGQLIGHLVMGVELIEKKCSQVMGFPDELKTICKHMVVAHHGRLDFGSPKTPMILEAHVLWSLDDLDSRIDSIGGLGKNLSESGWSSYSPLYERHFYYPNWNKYK